MRTFALGAVAAAFLIMPTSAFSAQIEVGPGGIRVGPGYPHHVYNYAGGRCAELRQACIHKQGLGEQGMGNCSRYRALCH
jgi:hypothetical protein